MRFLHGRSHHGPAPGLEGGDAVEHEALIGAWVQLADPEILALEREHADLVAWPHELDGGAGRLLGHLDLLAAHRAGLIDHQHHGQARLFLFLFKIAANRQDFFQAGLVVAPQTE